MTSLISLQLRDGGSTRFIRDFPHMRFGSIEGRHPSASILFLLFLKKIHYPTASSESFWAKTSSLILLCQQHLLGFLSSYQEWLLLPSQAFCISSLPYPLLSPLPFRRSPWENRTSLGLLLFLKKGLSKGSSVLCPNFSLFLSGLELFFLIRLRTTQAWITWTHKVWLKSQWSALKTIRDVNFSCIFKYDYILCIQ